MTMDLHASQIQGFFQVPVDNLVAEPTIASYIRTHISDYSNGVVVAKNPGAAKRYAPFWLIGSYMCHTASPRWPIRLTLGLPLSSAFSRRKRARTGP